MSKSLIKLPYSLVNISGPDAEKFLQGQLSCDVAALADNQWTFGTANTPKGRMYWLFVIARINDGFWIRVHNDILNHGLQTLAKYKVFFKCDITLAQSWQVYGEWQSDEHNAPKNRDIAAIGNAYMRRVTIEDARVEIWSDEQLDASGSEDNLSCWLQEDCRAGIPELYTPTLDTFILQQLNLHELGAVSFKKGCYTGQEIIARMKFLGKLKKRMYFFESEQKTTEIATPGSAVLDAENRKVGQVVRAHISSKGIKGLAVCDIQTTEAQNEAFLEELPGTRIALTDIHYNSF